MCSVFRLYHGTVSDWFVVLVSETIHYSTLLDWTVPRMLEQQISNKMERGLLIYYGMNERGIDAFTLLAAQKNPPSLWAFY